METEVPEYISVPPSWVHTDLQKLRTRRETHNTTERVNELRLYEAVMTSHITGLERSTSRRQKRLKRLEKELQDLRTQQEVELSLQERGRPVVEGTRNQVYYQKGTSRNYLFPSSLSLLIADQLRSPCPLSLYGFSILPSCVGNSTPPQEDTTADFLKCCAPLFQWSAAERLVKPPFFFDEPCLLECSAEEEAALPPTPSASTANTTKDLLLLMECRNAACAYWHHDQLAHMRMATQFCVATLHGLCARNEQLCCVHHLTSRLSRQADHAESVSGVCALVCEVLQTLIGLGLHCHLVKGKDAAQAMAAPTVKVEDVEQAAPSRGEFICKENEKQRWSEIAQRHAQRPMVSMLSVAVDHVQKHRDALSWRCLLACVNNEVQRLWLARQGIQLFPSCPQLHVEYVLNTLKCETSLEKAMEACVSSCRTLSAQAAASIVAGLDGGQYGIAVARHVGYMITMMFVHCAKKEADAALRFLAPFLSTDAEGGLSALLLPVARQNLAMMSVALRRVGHLCGVEHLPLAAVSEQVMELSCTDGANPSENGRDSIYSSLKLINAYKRDHFDPQLTTACAGALQLSLLRTFSHRLSYLERVAEKTVPESALAQGVVYCEYVSTIAQQQSVPAAVKVAESLAAAAGATCLLNLLLLSQLHMWGFPSELSAAQAITQLCASENFPIETLDSAEAVCEAAAMRKEVSAVEWVAAYALRMRSREHTKMPEEEKWAAMLRFPVEVLALDMMAAALYFALLLQLSGACRSAAKFNIAVRRCLGFFREVHAHAWSPLDASYASMVGLPQYLMLLIYEEVPLLLGSAAKETYEWRCLVLATAMELGVVHPLLISDAAA